MSESSRRPGDRKEAHWGMRGGNGTGTEVEVVWSVGKVAACVNIDSARRTREHVNTWERIRRKRDRPIKMVIPIDRGDGSCSRLHAISPETKRVGTADAFWPNLIPYSCEIENWTPGTWRNRYTPLARRRRILQFLIVVTIQKFSSFSPPAASSLLTQ